MKVLPVFSCGCGGDSPIGGRQPYRNPPSKPVATPRRVPHGIVALTHTNIDTSMAEEEREYPSTSDEAYAPSPSYVPAEEILRAYGRWEKPNEAVAQALFQQAHAQQATYPVPAEAGTEDLKTFGTGHALYFYWLKVSPCLEQVQTWVQTWGELGSGP